MAAARNNQLHLLLFFLLAVGLWDNNMTSAFETGVARLRNRRHHNLRRHRLHPVPLALEKMTVLKSSGSEADTDVLDNEMISSEIKDLMSKHDPILLFASNLLPPPTAKDASALYAWCRRLDEITDDPDVDDKSIIQERLADWENRFDSLCNGQPVDEFDAALTQCLQRNIGSLDEQPFRDMIAGMKSDAVDGRTVATMTDLELYSYQVAGTVGCMLLPLLNADVTLAREPAIALGQAIQLTNILRDATADAALGRVYLPQDMLKSENVTNEDILSLITSDGYCRVVQKVADRAHELLMEAEIGKSSLPGLGPLFVQIIVELYRGYLVKLQKMDYENLSAKGERVKISTLQKIGAAAKAMLKCLL